LAGRYFINSVDAMNIKKQTGKSNRPEIPDDWGLTDTQRKFIEDIFDTIDTPPLNDGAEQDLRHTQQSEKSSDSSPFR
jgi:hypothetical protein